MSENFFKINGLDGQLKLSGEIVINGAKNAALKVMASAVLFDDYVELENVPEIEDVERMGELLSGIGAKIEKPASSAGGSTNKRKIILPKKISNDLPIETAKAIRSSIVLTGPILARVGKVSFPNPGGCSIGDRPIDIFLEGFKKLGATIETQKKIYVVSAPKGLFGTEFFFKVQSHTGTETLMMAAVLSKGETVLKNCAIEPEIKSLAEFLNDCGANISGAGTSTIIIKGTKGKLLSSKKKIYKTIPDRIETGSFMILAALAGEKIVIKNCVPENVEIVTEILRTAGAKIEIGKNEITVFGSKNLSAVNIRTHEYPGMPTDLQAPMAVFLTQTNGESALFETIYEGRLGYIPDLVSMGAKIELKDSHRALIKGKTPLVGKKIKAPDLRAGMAFIIAAIIAKGESIIENSYVIDRGYENLATRLAKIGIDIKKE